MPIILCIPWTRSDVENGIYEALVNKLLFLFFAHQVTKRKIHPEIESPIQINFRGDPEPQKCWNSFMKVYNTCPPSISGPEYKHQQVGAGGGSSQMWKEERHRNTSLLSSYYL